MSEYNRLRKNIRRYYTFNSSVLNKDSNWQYSASDFESMLKSKYEGQSIKGIYIDGNEFSDSMHRLYHNFIDMSFGSSMVLIVLERDTLILYIHATGMFEYDEIDFTMLDLKEHLSDYEQINNEMFLFNICDCEVDNDFVDHKISSIEVTRTDAYPFSLHSFDEKMATESEKICDLPEKVIFNTDNNIRISFMGDVIEYFDISIEAAS